MKISVCMATYNGKNYLKEQLDSITRQTVKVDEICIVDDCSTDETVEIIKQYADTNIKLVVNNKNLGYVKTFENSIRISTGDLIFLSDQDDIWTSDKVEVVLDAFNNNPNIMLICHDANLVNEDNQPISEMNIYVKPGIYKKTSLFREFLKPRIYGCVSAFRSELNSTYLPFNNFVYTHDHWLAINGFLRGGCLVIKDKLINYRRHDQVLTLNKRRKLSKIILSRFNFLAMCIIAIKRAITNQ